MYANETVFAVMYVDYLHLKSRPLARRVLGGQRGRHGGVQPPVRRRGPPRHRGRGLGELQHYIYNLSTISTISTQVTSDTDDDDTELVRHKHNFVALDQDTAATPQVTSF